MKNLNKVLAMLVVFMMMLSTVAFASSFADVAAESSYSTAIEVGVDLGLFKGYEDGTFKPEGEITRAEFAAIVVRLLGQEAQAAGAKASTQFVDVPADHWAAGYVNIAVQAGVINGYGDGNFGPEDLVEYQDAITMMVRALGYEPAIGSAGYPTGYLTKAGELGLTTGVNGSNGVAANRGAVAQIAFNALDVPLMTQSGFGTFTQYVINDGYSSTMGTANVKKTLLSENYSTVKLQGIVESASEATSTSKNAEEYVMIEITDGLRNKFGIGFDKDGDLLGKSQKYYVGDSDVADYVGKKVVVFVEYDEFEASRTVKAIYEAKSDSLVIDLADVSDITYDAKDDLYRVKYYISESKTTSVTVDGDAGFYYNGVKDANNAKDWSKSDEVAELKNMSGVIELDLLGEASKGDYDTAFVTANYIFVVDEVKASTSRVTSKLEDAELTRIMYNEEDGNVKATLVDANGAAMDWTSLEEYDVLSVKWTYSGNKNLYEAKVISNTVEGTVTGLSGKKGEADRYVEIDGTEYKVLAVAEDDVIKLGDIGTYYLDENDNVVYHNATISKNNNYAFVIGFEAATDMDPAKVKVLTKENGIVTVEVANKITVSFEGEKANSISSKDFATSLVNKDEDLAKAIKDAGYTKLGDLVGKVVTYKINASGQVSAVEIPSAKPTDDYDYLVANKNNAKLDKYDEDDASFFVDGLGTCNLTTNTVIFYVPAFGTTKVVDGKDVPAWDEDDFEVVALSNLVEDQEFTGVNVYDVDDDDNIGVMAIVGADNTIKSSDENAVFVTKVTEAQDEDGSTVTRVVGYKGLSEVTFTTELEVSEDIIGTLVIPTYYANGDVKGFTSVTAFSADDEDKDQNGYKKTITDGYKHNASDDEKDTPTTSKKLYYADGTSFKISGANVYVFDATSSARVKYTIGADAAYFDYDSDSKYGVFVDDDNTHVKFYAYVYEFEGDVVDVVYYIYDRDGFKKAE